MDYIGLYYIYYAVNGERRNIILRHRKCIDCPSRMAHPERRRFAIYPSPAKSVPHVQSITLSEYQIWKPLNVIVDAIDRTSHFCPLMCN